MIFLKCAHQEYAWGKCGSQSEVAQLCRLSDEKFKVDEQKPYAELWVGTHPKGPSVVSNATTDYLTDWLAARKNLGSDSENAQSIQLPFLLKVLSVAKALSIQVHPNKEEAKKLHAEDPANYPDDNHKPEMAIALTPFEILCGFRPALEIVQFIVEVPELLDLVKIEAFDKLTSALEAGNEEQVKLALKDCFTNLMKSDPELVKQKLVSLIERIALRMTHGSETSHILGDIVLRLHSEFTGDIGCFAPYFLNHFVLQPGEATFLGSGEPHAYLFGDCIECQACSDNTVRAGLTPKFKDVTTLCEMLTYRMGSPEENKLTPTSVPGDAYRQIYKPPVEDFIVEKIAINESGVLYTLSVTSLCTIFIVISGAADVESTTSEVSHLRRGSIGLITENQKVSLKICQAPFLMYLSYTDMKY